MADKKQTPPKTGIGSVKGNPMRTDKAAKAAPSISGVGPRAPATKNDKG